MRSSQQRLILAHWNPLTGPVAILYFPPFLTVRSDHITKFSLKEQEQKGKSMPLLVRCIWTFHMSSSMPFFFHLVEDQIPVKLFSMEEPAIKWKGSRLLSDCVKGSLPTSLTLSNFVSRKLISTGLPCGSDGKASAYNAGDLGSIPRSGRFPGEGNGNPCQYSWLENPMEGGAW